VRAAEFKAKAAERLLDVQARTKAKTGYYVDDRAMNIDALACAVLCRTPHICESLGGRTPRQDVGGVVLSM